MRNYLHQTFIEPNPGKIWNSNGKLELTLISLKRLLQKILATLKAGIRKQESYMTKLLMNILDIPMDFGKVEN